MILVGIIAYQMGIADCTQSGLRNDLISIILLALTMQIFIRAAFVEEVPPRKYRVHPALHSNAVDCPLGDRTGTPRSRVALLPR